MKKWTFGGASVILICCAALTMRIGCNVDLRIEKADVTPPEHRMGWDEEAAHDEATKKLIASMPEFRIDGVKRDNRKANVRLWDYAEEIGVEIPNYRQEIGDCVSFGAANAVDYLQCVQIALGHKSEFQSAYEPYIYGTSRIQVGGGRLGNSDGSVGAWAAKAVQQYGVLSVEADGVPKYAGRIAKQWGYRGPPEEFLSIGKETLVKTVSPMRSAADVRDAICNGYPVTIASNAGFGSISEHDGRQVGRWTTSWAHQMCIVGYDGSTNAGPWFYVLNSWGGRAHPRPVQGEPMGGFWISESDCDRIVKQDDSFAFSSFDGFPAQELDFNVLRTAQVQIVPIGKDAVMLIVSLCGVVLFGVLLRSYRKSAAGLAAVLLLSGVAYGIDDFDVMSAAEPESIATFDVMAEAKPIEGMDFAVLTDECRCAVTGKCDCDDCDCTDCPKEQQQSSNLIAFGADWCECPTAKAAAESAGVRYVDIEANPELAKRYRIDGLPALVRLNGDGEKLAHFVGSIGFKRKLAEWQGKSEQAKTPKRKAVRQVNYYRPPAHLQPRVRYSYPTYQRPRNLYGTGCATCR